MNIKRSTNDWNNKILKNKKLQIYIEQNKNMSKLILICIILIISIQFNDTHAGIINPLQSINYCALLRRTGIFSKLIIFFFIL